MGLQASLVPRVYFSVSRHQLLKVAAEPNKDWSTTVQIITQRWLKTDQHDHGLADHYGSMEQVVTGSALPEKAGQNVRGMAMQLLTPGPAA